MGRAQETYKLIKLIMIRNDSVDVVLTPLKDLLSVIGRVAS